MCVCVLVFWGVGVGLGHILGKREECRRLDRIFLRGFRSGGRPLILLGKCEIFQLNSQTVVVWVLHCFGCVDVIFPVVVGGEDARDTAA